MSAWESALTSGVFLAFLAITAHLLFKCSPDFGNYDRYDCSNYGYVRHQDAGFSQHGCTMVEYTVVCEVGNLN